MKKNLCVIMLLFASTFFDNFSYSQQNDSESITRLLHSMQTQLTGDFIIFISDYQKSGAINKNSKNSLRKYFFYDQDWNYFVSTLVVNDPKDFGKWRVNGQIVSGELGGQSFTIDTSNSQDSVYVVNDQQYKFSDKLNTYLGPFEDYYREFRKEFLSFTDQSKKATSFFQFLKNEHGVLLVMNELFGFADLSAKGSVAHKSGAGLAAAGWTYGMNVLKNGVNAIDYTGKGTASLCKTNFGEGVANYVEASRCVVQGAVGLHASGEVFDDPSDMNPITMGVDAYRKAGERKHE